MSMAYLDEIIRLRNVLRDVLANISGAADIIEMDLARWELVIILLRKTESEIRDELTNPKGEIK